MAAPSPAVPSGHHALQPPHTSLGWVLRGVFTAEVFFRKIKTTDFAALKQAGHARQGINNLLTLKTFFQLTCAKYFCRIPVLI